MLSPQDHLGVIDGSKGFDFAALRSKSASIHIEFMFYRSTLGTPDIARQHEILNEVADLVDAGTFRMTMTKLIGRIDAANVRRAHAIVESGRAVDRIVLEVFV
jgi:NADPH:quinone reductase-like Zn-dependent oxidoreductase